MTWNSLLADSIRITQEQDLAPGDVVFLTNTANGGVLAFTVQKLLRRDGQTLLWITEQRFYRLGGASQLHFDHALRERNPK